VAKRPRKPVPAPERKATATWIPWVQVIIRETVDLLLWWANRGWRL
jgi:hypothetical protein